MRQVISTLALSLSVFACAADAAPEGDVAASSDEALATAGRVTTTRYAGSFEAGGERYRVELDVTMSLLGIGYQRSDSTRFRRSESPRCRVFDEWVPGTVALRVYGQDGRVVAEATRPSGANGYADLDAASECPEGVLAHPRVHPVLEASVDADGVGFEAAGKAVHVPRGYFQPGLVSVAGTARFRALSPSSFTDESDGGFDRSSFVVERGLIALRLPTETTVSVGIGPSFGASMGYEQVVDVTLRAQ